MKTALPHEHLEAYQLAADFVPRVLRIAERIPQDYEYLGQDLEASALAIPAHIAQGAGQATCAEQARDYGHARGKVYRVAALLDICRCFAVAVIKDEDVAAVRAVLVGISTALSAMIARLRAPS